MEITWDKDKFCVFWRRGGNWLAFFLFWMISSAIVSMLEHSEQNKELTKEEETKQEVDGIKGWVKAMEANDTIVNSQIDKLVKLLDNPATPKLWAKFDFEYAIMKHNLASVAIDLLADEFSRIMNDQLEKDDIESRQLAADFVNFFKEDNTVLFANKSIQLHAKGQDEEEKKWEKRCLEKKNKGLTCDEQWSFGDSLHYTSTVFTATGYGAKTAITSSGKFVTILMIMTQLPFFLHCLATTAKNINHRLDRLLGLSDKHDDMDDLAGDGANDTNTWHRRVVMLKGMLIMTAVLAVHMMIAAIYTTFTTGWGFGNVLYFQFVNYASIGFGDLVPEDEFTVAGAIFKNLLIKIPAEIILFAMLIRVLPIIS